MKDLLAKKAALQQALETGAIDQALYAAQIVALDATVGSGAAALGDNSTALGERAVQIDTAVNSTIETGDRITINLGNRQLEIPFQAPSLPEARHYVERPEELAHLKEQLLSAETSTPQQAIIHGMAAVGKSVLASAFAHDEATRQRFPGGVLWVTLGQQPNLAQRLSDWGRALNDPTIYASPYADAATGTGQLRSLLQNRRCLLVVDDVWDAAHVSPFEVGGTGCLLLLTSRNRAVASDALALPLDVMRASEGMQLMANWAGVISADDQPIAAALAETVGYLPLALELVGAQVSRYGSWQKVADRWEQGRVAALRRGRHAADKNDNVELSFQLSLDSLPAADQALYQQLAVFGEDRFFPLTAAMHLWRIDRFEAEELLLELVDRALLIQRARHDGDFDYGMHDLLHDFLRQSLTEADVQRAHQQIVAGYRQLCGGAWGELEDDGYVFGSLALHMRESEQPDALFSLIDQAWMRERFAIGYSYSGFSADVEHAIAIAQADNNLVELARCLLVRCLLQRVSAETSPKAIYIFARRGQLKKARGYAALMTTQRPQQCQSLFMLAQALYETDRFKASREQLGIASATLPVNDEYINVEWLAPIINAITVCQDKAALDWLMLWVRLNEIALDKQWYVALAQICTGYAAIGLTALAQQQLAQLYDEVANLLPNDGWDEDTARRVRVMQRYGMEALAGAAATLDAKETLAQIAQWNARPFPLLAAALTAAYAQLGDAATAQRQAAIAFAQAEQDQPDATKWLELARYFERAGMLELVGKSADLALATTLDPQTHLQRFFMDQNLAAVVTMLDMAGRYAEIAPMVNSLNVDTEALDSLQQALAEVETRHDNLDAALAITEQQEISYREATLQWMAHTLAQSGAFAQADELVTKIDEGEAQAKLYADLAFCAEAQGDWQLADYLALQSVAIAELINGDHGWAELLGDFALALHTVKLSLNATTVADLGAQEISNIPFESWTERSVGNVIRSVIATGQLKVAHRLIQRVLLQPLYTELAVDLIGKLVDGGFSAEADAALDLVVAKFETIRSRGDQLSVTVEIGRALYLLGDAERAGNSAEYVLTALNDPKTWEQTGVRHAAERLHALAQLTDNADITTATQALLDEDAARNQYDDDVNALLASLNARTDFSDFDLEQALIASSQRTFYVYLSTLAKRANEIAQLDNGTTLWTLYRQLNAVIQWWR